jgi:hypothetical protein
MIIKWNDYGDFPYWTILVPLTNLSFGFIFETRTFSLPHFSISRGWKRPRKKKGRERERERDFYYGKIGGEGTFADVYKEEKGKDESIRRLVGFPNGLDGDWSKAQKDLNDLIIEVLWILLFYHTHEISFFILNFLVSYEKVKNIQRWKLRHSNYVGIHLRITLIL